MHGSAEVLWRRTDIPVHQHSSDVADVIEGLVHAGAAASRLLCQLHPRPVSSVCGALDAKVLVRAARVVGGGEDEAAICLAAVAVADHCRHRWRGQQAAHAHPHLRGQPCCLGHAKSFVRLAGGQQREAQASVPTCA